MEVWREELYANELYHYGVKGMKWRHRKTPEKPENTNEKRGNKPRHSSYDHRFTTGRKYYKPNRGNKKPIYKLAESLRNKGKQVVAKLFKI